MPKKRGLGQFADLTGRGGELGKKEGEVFLRQVDPNAQYANSTLNIPII